MRFANKFIIIIFSILLLCGCQNSADPTNGNSPGKNISVNQKNFSVEEIQKGIEETFNSILYYNGNDEKSVYLTANKNLVLHRELEYELYYEPNTNTDAKAFVFAPKIYLIITNVSHPLSSEETEQLYVFGIDITQWGLRSDFSYHGKCVVKDNTPDFDTQKMQYLGKHTMLIDEIKKPSNEKTDVTWKENTEKSIRLYMDKNDFYKEQSKNLAPGNYRIYVKPFFMSDKDSTIIFEHENGDIYVGNFYFVHESSGKSPADLNKVTLCKNPKDKSFESYFEKIRSESAVTVEYKVD